MKPTNHLGSHSPESYNHRADKMSGIMGLAGIKKQYLNKSKRFIKKFTTRKRRGFLKNKNNWDKF